MNKIILILMGLIIGAPSQVAPVKVDAAFTIQFEGMTLEKLAQMEKHLMEICKDAEAFNMAIIGHSYYYFKGEDGDTSLDHWTPAPGKIDDLFLYPIFGGEDADTSLYYWTPLKCDTINWYMPFANDTTRSNIQIDEHSIKAEIWLQK